MGIAVPTDLNEERIERAEEEQVVTEPAAKVDAKRMFRYSEFLDLGEGAQECEHSRDGQCDDVEHFHAWCRLPNPYQHDDIRAKAMAAKARRIRELKDPDSDVSVILDVELSQIDDPAFVDRIVDELLSQDWTEDYLEAQADVEEQEEYEHVNQDREEFNRLRETEQDLPESEQSPEFAKLAEHMGNYVNAIRARLEERQEPRREELKARPVEDLCALVRSKRVEQAADRTFVDTYNTWMWFVGTFKVEPHPTLRRPHLPMWEDIGVKDRASAGTMFAEAPEVIEAIQGAFQELSLAVQRASAGN